LIEYEYREAEYEYEESPNNALDTERRSMRSPRVFISVQRRNQCIAYHFADGISRSGGFRQKFPRDRFLRGFKDLLGRTGFGDATGVQDVNLMRDGAGE